MDTDFGMFFWLFYGIAIMCFVLTPVAFVMMRTELKTALSWTDRWQVQAGGMEGMAALTSGMALFCMLIARAVGDGTQWFEMGPTALTVGRLVVIASTGLFPAMVIVGLVFLRRRTSHVKKLGFFGPKLRVEQGSLN